MWVQYPWVGDEYCPDKGTYPRTPGNHPQLIIKNTSTPWYPATVVESGIGLPVRLHNLLTNVGNQNRGAVLAKPFPCLVSQWVILVFIIINSQL